MNRPASSLAAIAVAASLVAACSATNSAAPTVAAATLDAGARVEIDAAPAPVMEAELGLNDVSVLEPLPPS